MGAIKCKILLFVLINYLVYQFIGEFCYAYANVCGTCIVLVPRQFRYVEFGD